VVPHLAPLGGWSGLLAIFLSPQTVCRVGLDVANLAQNFVELATAAAFGSIFEVLHRQNRGVSDGTISDGTTFNCCEKSRQM